jgi:hypothetical protein
MHSLADERKGANLNDWKESLTLCLLCGEHNGMKFIEDCRPSIWNLHLIPEVGEGDSYTIDKQKTRNNRLLALSFDFHRFYGGRSPKFIWAPCHVTYTAVFFG